jgi:hypothetical protein
MPQRASHSPVSIRRMHDTAAFKFDSLPDVTFTATRAIRDEKEKPGTITIKVRRDPPDHIDITWLSSPEPPPGREHDTPFVPGGKVPFVFRSLPGVTFYATRITEEMVEENPGGFKSIKLPGWVVFSYRRDGDDEEITTGGWAGPEA